MQPRLLKIFYFGIALQGLAGLFRLFHPLPITLAFLGTWIGAIALLFHALSFRRAIQFLIGALLWTWAGEFLGQKYGIFGVKYHYVPENWPSQIAPFLSITIPWIWFMMLLPSWILARSILSRTGHEVFSPLLTGALMVFWDMILDPTEVSRGLWVWEKSGLYYGIPFENFLGWFFGVTIAIFSIERVLGKIDFTRETTASAGILYGMMMAFLIIDAPEWPLRVFAGLLTVGILLKIGRYKMPILRAPRIG